MRFALRNKHKIEKAFDKDFLGRLMFCLNKYSKTRKTYLTQELDGYKAIGIESKNHKHYFIVISQTYDVVKVAYYKSVKINN